MGIRRAVLAAAVIAALTACGSSGDDPVNLAPTANAGSAQNVIAGSTVVTLDGSRSTDPNGDALRYAWLLTGKPTGSTAALSDPGSPRPTFVADLPGSYVASLVVNDGSLASSASTVTVTAAMGNVTPVASAGTAQNVLTGATVTLDGSASTDANGDALLYTWTLASRPAGSAATLSGAATARPTFVADAAGTYVARLVVNDGQVDSAAATVTISATVANAAPVANAGAAQTVVAGAVVALNGGGSSDANGDALTCAWTLTSRPAGSAAALTSATAVNPAFTADLPGTYVATLVVNDGKVSSAPSTVAITAETVVGFDSITPLPPNMPSMGFEAYALTSFGERVVLKSGAPRTLRSVDVAMSSWACQTGGWNTLDCATAANATFTHPITLRIYDASGNLLKTVTQTFTLPYRPSADLTCVGADAGKWKAANGTCYNGYASTITFDLVSENVQLPSDTFAFDVVYNTRTWGPSPLGVTGPYDSLNVGLATVAPSVGTDAEPGFVLRNGTLSRIDPIIDYGIMAKVVVGAP